MHKTKKSFSDFCFKIKNSSKSISFIWLISYLVIFMLPFVSSMFVHFKAVDILTEQSAQMADQIISIEQKEFDRLYDMCNTTYVSVMNHPMVNTVMGMSPGEHISEIDAYELKSDLFRMIMDQNYIIDDVWLMFNNIDYGVSTLRAEPMEDFFAAEESRDISNIKLDDVTGEYTGKFVRTPSGFAYFKTLGLSVYGEKAVNFVLFIAEDDLRAKYREFIADDSGIMLLYNSDNELIYSSVDVDEEFSDKAKQADDDYKIHIGGSKYIVSTGKMRNVTYVYLVEEKVITRPMQFLKMIIAITVILSLLVGVFMILYLIKKNIKPVNDIMNMLGSGSDALNEFDTIKQGIHQQSTENKTLSTQVNLFKPMAIDNLIHNLVLYGNMDRYTMGHLGIRLDREYFVLSALDIDSMGIFFEDEDENLIENNQRLATVAITNIFTELLEKYGSVYCGSLQDKIIILVNSDKDCADEIHESMERGCRLINQHFDMTVYLAQSRSISSIEGLPQVYGMVHEQLENMQLSGEHGAVICDFDTRDFGEFRNEKKADFVKYIFEADTKNAVRILNDITHSSAPKGVIRYFVADMMTEAAKELSRKVGNEVKISETINLIMESPRMQMLEEQLAEIVKDMCRISAGSNEGVETKVYELINENYKNPDLNVTVIAANFNITPAYLSYKFRDHYHINILDYLGKLRIEHAKKLILETDHTIEEIYKECGYISRATFVRQFKKYVDLTPGKFKQMYS